jgi:hypothetical protein
MPVRRFIRQKEDLLLDLAHWTWALEEAAQGLHMDVEYGAVLFPTVLRMPSLHRYVRNYYEKNKRTGNSVKKEEWFEMIREGTILTIPVTLAHAKPGQAKPTPTPEQFKTMMAEVGETIGLSPFGNRMGFGRFEVVSVIEQ